MEHTDWLRVGAKVDDLWPGRGWPPASMATGYELFAAMPYEGAVAALLELAAGREHPPAPGVLLAAAQAWVRGHALALQDPDLTRPLTAAEQERAKRMRAALTGGQAVLVQSTWRVFANHARVDLNRGQSAQAAAERLAACGGLCEPVANRSRRPGVTSAMADPWMDECCVAGRPLYEAWREAVFNMVAA